MDNNEDISLLFLIVAIELATICLSIYLLYSYFTFPLSSEEVAILQGTEKKFILVIKNSFFHYSIIDSFSSENICNNEKQRIYRNYIEKAASIPFMYCDTVLSWEKREHTYILAFLFTLICNAAIIGEYIEEKAGKIGIIILLIIIFFILYLVLWI